ncbi:STAS domain-containing protein [Sphingomonas sp.]|uniref:STAS domain-containing protein n=1 Tax=Sphingomonas sp. TaxID=28214 RepID=UPI001DA4063C|nr:STAS domain-containing protein [Sphingomonas sp.]MBX9797128.1 STAS domain-containing protein [Sphingomonas sp.]
MAEINLPARCDRQAIVGLVDPILAALNAGAVTIDAREVAKPGQALLQLLYSARKTAESLGQTCTILPSDALREMAEMAGAHALFEGQAA